MMHITTEDYRIEEMHILPCADIEYTTDLMGNGYMTVDLIAFDTWIRNVPNGCDNRDFQIFQAQIPGTVFTETGVSIIKTTKR